MPEDIWIPNYADIWTKRNGWMEHGSDDGTVHYGDIVTFCDIYPAYFSTGDKLVHLRCSE